MMPIDNAARAHDGATDTMDDGPTPTPSDELVGARAAAAGDFAAEVRERTTRAGLSLAQLAERAGLDPSLVSRLVSSTDATRRAPRPEHVLAVARALGAHPLELGTEAAATLLVDWLPRAELEREITARHAAQRAADEAVRTLEALRAGELASLRAQLETVERRLTTADEARARAERVRRRAETERDETRARAGALEQARRALAAELEARERELAEARQVGLALWREAKAASDDALGAKLLGLVGTIGAAAAGLAVGAHAAATRAATPPKPAGRARRRASTKTAASKGGAKKSGPARHGTATGRGTAKSGSRR